MYAKGEVISLRISKKVSDEALDYLNKLKKKRQLGKWFNDMIEQEIGTAIAIPVKKETREALQNNPDMRQYIGRLLDGMTVEQQPMRRADNLAKK
jgi:hypothetical protein